MAAAVFDGAQDEVHGIACLRAAEATLPDDIASAAAFVFVCPENLGSMTGEMKAFFDRCYYPLLGHLDGRPFATAIAAGTAGQGTEAQIDRIVTGWRLRRVAPGLIVRLNADRPETIGARKVVSGNELQKCRDLGRLLAAGLQLGVF
jgi:multimeric flavodoxin WrbA